MDDATSYERLIGYNDLDPVKRAASAAARQTSGNAASLGFEVIEWSRGESVFLMRDLLTGVIHGDVIEGLGTKNKVADRIRSDRLAACRIANAMAETGRSYYDSLAQDTLAMALNDMATLNIWPRVVNVHWAVGDSKIFRDEQLVSDLIEGTRHTCDLVGCVWGGGETPTLRDINIPDALALSCSVSGFVRPESKLITAKVQDGDLIYGLGSSGVMANGLTLGRDVGDKLPRGYFTELPDGRSYGEAMLTPTDLYGPAIRRMVDAGADIHYTVNVTGHGFRKMMRLDAEYSYVIEKVPEPQPEFQLIQEVAGISTREMYETFNMGLGYAVIGPPEAEEAIFEAAGYYGFSANRIGYVEKGQRLVHIVPLDLEWTGEELGVR